MTDQERQQRDKFEADETMDNLVRVSFMCPGINTEMRMLELGREPGKVLVVMVSSRLMDLPRAERLAEEMRASGFIQDVTDLAVAEWELGDPSEGKPN